MIIVGDIGNTEVKICFFYNGLKKKYLFKTDSLNKKIQTSRLVISNLRIIKKILSNYIKSKIKIKRPNDITVNKKKICGILNETLFYSDFKFLVIGIGINMVSSPNIRGYPTTNLNEITNKTISKTKLLNKIIKAFDIKIK